MSLLLFQRRGASAAPGPDAETASAIVSGAGSDTSNGTYVRSGSLNGRPSYAFEVGPANTISWSGSAWEIYDDSPSLMFVTYFSSDDVAYPWLVTTWEIFEAFPPVPTVTIG